MPRKRFYSPVRRLLTGFCLISAGVPVCFSFTEEQVFFVFSCANDERALALDHRFFLSFSLFVCARARLYLDSSKASCVFLSSSTLQDMNEMMLFSVFFFDQSMSVD